MKNFEVGERVHFINANKLRTGRINKFSSGTGELYAHVELDDDQVTVIVNTDNIAKLEQPEPVKVPEFVGEMLDAFHRDFPDSSRDFLLERILDDFLDGYLRSENEFEDDWISNNLITLIDAVRNGCVVEEEPKYYVKLPFSEWDEDASELVPKDKYLAINARSGSSYLCSHRVALAGARRDSDWKSRLTEEQIKSADERYWAFAVPVEELEAE